MQETRGADLLSEQFDSAFLVLLRNLGPQTIVRAQLGLTPGQVFMLQYIERETPCSVSKLADKLEVNPSAITVMLDRLENHSFVERQRDTHDRRVVMAKITNLGKEKLNQVLRVRRQIVQHCLEQIPPTELDSFLQTFEKLAAISASMDIAAIIQLEDCQEG